MSCPPARNAAVCPPKTLGAILDLQKVGEHLSESHWAALVQMIADGDQRALYALYTQTHRLVFTLIVRIVGHRERAEDLTLDVFHDVWRQASTYDPATGPVIGWILNQARSKAIDCAVRTWNERVGDPASRPVIEFRQQAELVRQALRVLTPDERRTIETAFFSGLTHDEVAQKLSQPLETVKTRVRSGFAKLRQALTGRV